MYADDVIVYVSGKCPTEVFNILQNDLNRINDWCKTMYLTVNTQNHRKSAQPLLHYKLGSVERVCIRLPI